MRFGIIGSGSWGTALAKMLADNKHPFLWWIRKEETITQFKERNHNPDYLQAASLNLTGITLTTRLDEVIKNSDAIIIAIPSAFAVEVLAQLDSDALKGKKIISAIKGILPNENILLNEHLKNKFDLPLENYFAVMGPCHAEEVAAERLSYLTFAGMDKAETTNISAHFKTWYTNIIVSQDIFGVQNAAVLKNIYALGAGIAHGLGYGDNFLSVFIANAADEMAGFLRKAGILNAEVGYIEQDKTQKKHHQNYAASVYLGDLLVTCYSLHSRNRAFGNMIGKGYSVQAAQLEMSMVAEGYNASKCMYINNQSVQAKMPIAETVYNILWNKASPKEAMQSLEKQLV